MADPLVAVVVATLDRPDLLRRALGSVANQSLEAELVQVVVVDDGGRDPGKVAAAVAQVRAGAPELRVDVVHAPVSLGRSGARNLALELVESPHLVYLDDDDLLHADHLARLVAAVAGTDELVAWTGSERVLEDAGGLELARDVHADGGGAPLERTTLLAHNVFPIHAAIVPVRQLRAIGGFDEQLQVLEDWDLWLRLEPRVRFERLPGIGCEFRHRDGHDNSVTRERAQHVLGIEQVYERHPLPEDGSYDALRDRRRRIVEGSSAGLDAAWRYERSVLVRLPSDADVAAVHARLGRIAATQDDVPGRWEAVIAAPRTPQIEQALVGVDGDVTVVWHPANTTIEERRKVDTALRRRATGLEIVVAEEDAM